VVIGQAKIPVLDLAGNYEIFSDYITKGISPYFEEYGLELLKILVENISLPPEVEEAIDKRGSRAIQGNLNEYLQYETANSLSKSGNSASSMIGAEMGLIIGQQMAQSMANNMNSQQTHQQQQSSMPPPPPHQSKWYIAKNGETKGPYSENDLKNLISSGEVDESTYVWKEGFENWKKAKEAIPNLFNSTPPPPPPPPPM